MKVDFNPSQIEIVGRAASSDNNSHRYISL